MIKYVFFALACVPAACYAQPIGICFEEYQTDCAFLGQGYGGPCSSTACDPLNPRHCPKLTPGLVITDPNRLYWDVRPATGVGSTITAPPPPNLKCGDIYDCSCDPMYGNNCLHDDPAVPFIPGEWRIGAINCP